MNTGLPASGKATVESLADNWGKLFAVAGRREKIMNPELPTFPHRREYPQPTLTLGERIIAFGAAVLFAVILFALAAALVWVIGSDLIWL